MIARLPVWARWLLVAKGASAAWVVFALAAPHGAPPGAVLQGIVLGSATALTSVGLILVWRANRFINFAQMALGAAVGLTAVHLFLTWGWPYPVALVCGLVGGVVLGALVEVAIVRRFSNATRLVLTVASIGLAQLLGGLELILPKQLFGVTSFVQGSFDTPLSGELFTLSSIRFSGDYLLIVAVVPIATGALAWMLLRTSAGIAVRASAENQDRALLLGIPVTSLHALVWAIAGGLATLTFMLRAPIVGTVASAAMGPSVLLPALTAALIAKMESLPKAVVSAMLLGALEGVIRWNSPDWPLEALDLVNLAVILVALLAQRRASSRAHDLDGTWQDTASVRPLDPRLAALRSVQVAKGAGVLVLVAAIVGLPFLLGPSDINSVSTSVIWAIVGVSLVALTGWSGQISLGQFGLVGVGAIVAGNLMAKWDVDMFLSLAAAAAAGMVVALVLGVPALRIRGPFLAVVTLAFAVMLDSFVLNPDIFPSIVPQVVERPVVWNRFPLDDERTMFYLCVAGLVLAVLMARGARRARSGRLLMAVRDNRKASEAMSVNARRTALQGFLLAGAVAGMAGGLDVMLLRGARRSTFEPSMSIEAFSHTTIGGLGSLGGAILGSMGLRSLEGELPQGGKLVLNGVGLLIVLYLIPGGVAEGVARLRDLVLRPLARRHGIARTVHATTGDAAPPSPGSVARDGSGRGDLALTARGIDVSYGSLQVLFGVDLEVRRGEMVALLGTNGAGKSTLLRAVCGLTSSSGTIRVTGRDGAVKDIGGRRADRIVGDGVALMPGGRSVFPTLTVGEHLRLATWTFRHDDARIDAELAHVFAVFPVLRDLFPRLAGDLSGGEQQQLALAQTLMLRPEVLLIDELSLGLAPGVVARLLQIVRDLHAAGMTIVLVEQSVNIALALAERALFMEKGAVRFEGPTRDLLDRPDVLRAVFLAGDTGPAAGDEADPAAVPEAARGAEVIVLPGSIPAAPPPAEPDPVAPVLQTIGVSKRFGGVVAVDDVDLTVAAGTILGLVGQNGAGKTTLLDCISGFHQLDAGRLLLGGVDVTDRTPWQRARGRMGRSFQEARLFPSLTVAETVAVACERTVASRSMVADVLHQPASFESELGVAGRVDEILALLNLDEHRRKLTAELSTGMRRIVELACLLAADPVVLLLDEPSAGVAQRDAEALAPLLIRVRDETGAALVVIEHDMPLLRSMCDEMVALELGAVIARGTPDEVLADERVISGYLGTDATAVDRSGAAASV